MSVSARTQAREIATPATGHAARSLASWTEFQARITELGGEVLEPAWLGSKEPHRVRCGAGHEYSPRPNDVQKGQQGSCHACRDDNEKARCWSSFLEQVAELGGVVLEPAWLGSSTPHRVRCAEGHEGTPRPSSINLGQGICRTCAGLDPAAAWRAFQARVTELGGSIVEPTWLGNNKPHRVRCAAGHDCAPRPAGVSQGQGICQVCAHRDPATAWAAFRAKVTELGGKVLEPVWLGSSTPHRVRCAAGHDCAPRPLGVSQGRGLCRTCAGMVWDAFYVVTNDTLGRLKFGITSGDPRGRLGVHRGRGYRTVIRSLTSLPGTVAPDMERDVIATLRLAGEQPIHGREYYGIHVLATVLDIVDNYPTATAQPFASGDFHV